MKPNIAEIRQWVDDVCDGEWECKDDCPKCKGSAIVYFRTEEGRDWTECKYLAPEDRTVTKESLTTIVILCDEIERLQAYIDKTNYDSEQIAINSKQLEIDVERQSKEIDRLKKALEFYADHATYDVEHLDRHGYIIIDDDGGGRAREALRRDTQDA